MTVTVKVLHRTSRPYSVWVEPIGWEPDIDQFGEGVVFDGAVWDNNGEVAGIAATYADLGCQPEEGAEYSVSLRDLFWMSSGDNRYLGGVQQLKGTNNAS